MKITLRNRNLTPAESFDALIENSVFALSARQRLDEATVTLERLTDASPPFRVTLHIAVPGPDVRCEVVDYSPVRAFARALDYVDQILRERAARRVSRTKHRALRTAGARFGSRGSR
jgi:hypothetical protein